MTSHRFEQRTTEAAKLKLDVDKANETIGAAENLIGKLEGEYKRWSAQVCVYLQYHTFVCTLYIRMYMLYTYVQYIYMYSMYVRT